MENPYVSAGLEDREGDAVAEMEPPKLSSYWLVFLLASPICCFVGWIFQRWPTRLPDGVADLGGLAIGVVFGMIGISCLQLPIPVRIVLGLVFLVAFPVVALIVGMFFVCYAFGDCV